MESDREERARIEVKHDKVMERMLRLEKLNGIVEEIDKPKCVVELENRHADLKAEYYASMT